MPRQTIAEKYRQHRHEMTLALQLGCTPNEARAKIRWDQARERIELSEARIAKRADAPLRLRDLPDEAWMMRDR